MPRKKKPRIARLDQVRISRDGEDAIIEFLDTGIATTHLTIGPQVQQMTDDEILLLFNQTIAAQIRNRDELGEYVAVEVPSGSPQVEPFPGTMTDWVPRGGVLRCVIDDGGGEDGSLPVIHVDDQEFDWEEFGRLSAPTPAGECESCLSPTTNWIARRGLLSGNRTTSRQGTKPMSLEKVQIPSERPIYPTPAGLVTTVDGDGNPNIITLGEIYNLSIRKPVIVGLGIAPNATRTGFFASVASSSSTSRPRRCWTRYWRAARSRGRDVRDKFAMAGLTPLPAQRVKPPLIAECPVNLECRLLDDPEPIGDHDLFKGEVLVEHVDADLIDEKGDLRVERLDMLIFARWTFWTVGKQIGIRG